ncbi:MAG: helix-turn-helix transcriptional regulator [Actinomycetes bacterium]
MVRPSQPGDDAPSRGLGLARVRGASMEPTLRDGDLLLVRWGAPPRAGRLAVVRLPDGRPLSVKRLTRQVDDGWWVERDNPREGVDSWLVGALPPSDVLAVALLRLPRWLSGRS